MGPCLLYYCAGLGAHRPDDDLPPECKIYVGSLPPNVDEHALTREFARFGPVLRCGPYVRILILVLLCTCAWLMHCMCFWSCSFLAWVHSTLLPFDVCSARVITDRETGRPKGFGFVNMAGELPGSSSLATGLLPRLDVIACHFTEIAPLSVLQTRLLPATPSPAWMVFQASIAADPLSCGLQAQV